MVIRKSKSTSKTAVVIGKLVISAVATVAIGLSGCLVGPDHIDPGAPFQCEWIPPLPPGVSQSANDSVSWWTKFNDPVLSSLVVRTAEQNLTLGQAAERIAEARATRGIVRGGLFPDIDGIGSYTRRKTSGSGNSFGLDNFNPPPFNFWSAGFDATWEIDVFGGVRRRLQAADADVDVAIEDHNDLLVTLQGEVGGNYIQVRTLQRRIEFVERNIELQAQSLKITEDRFAAGTVSQLDVEQAKSNLYSTEAALPLLRQELELAYHRLSVLMGEPPSDLSKEITPQQRFPMLPSDIDVGLPIELIRQRPDIRSAERQLAAQAARIGVAVSELYPRFTITGTFTVDSTRFSQWFTNESIAYAAGPAARWRLLDFGRVRSDIEVQRARWRGLVFNYQNEVITAAQEVEDALSQYRYSIQRAKSLREAALAARAASEISEEQYKGGIIPFQTLLDAQRFQADLDDQATAAEGDIYLAVVSLYKALGGGWIDPFAVAPDPTAVPAGEIIAPGSVDANADGENVEDIPLDDNLIPNIPEPMDGLLPADALPPPAAGAN
ncbi:efflux transporter outer membrane subunit [Bremerella alba]|uniref:Solvent efflux pump outer membrane protein SrpC n=1 Tax=Bremerella alba TaxID=980252 RepID=A0A7V8V7W8_9BACT|nr:efflux transporter outer membrane subunit [Bremerella alba]MBA2116550.1 Solvent efflux pump outer membrane protein SrpC [Bremerella alba]